MKDDSAWSAAVARLPFGAVVHGVVTQRYPFGVFVRLTEAPDVTAIVEINNYRPHSVPVSPEDLPAVGDRIEGVVVDHAEFNQQIRLRVGGTAASRA
ncbi:MAG TPA: hypothetical protein VMU51_21710 [Mycobacteriales bacterium]|nr:hypothetical protein [Mycobacteriales bacterium]